MDGDWSRYAGIGLLVSPPSSSWHWVGQTPPRRASVVSQADGDHLHISANPVVAFLLAVVFFLIGPMVSRGAILSAAVLSFGALTTLRPRVVFLSGRPCGRSRVLPDQAGPVDLPRFVPVEPLIQGALGGLSIKHTMHLRGADDTRACCRKGFRRTVSPMSMSPDRLGRLCSTAALEECLSALREFCVPVSVMFSRSRWRYRPGFCSGHRREPCTFRSTARRSVWSERIVKRLFDICFSIAALTAALPLCALVALAIKADSRGRSSSCSAQGAQRQAVPDPEKFRSMTVMEDSATSAQATRNDPRVTRVGAFIRSTSIDELPQFWNVLRGEISVIPARVRTPLRMTISTER